jgi:hypothetical protein
MYGNILQAISVTKRYIWTLRIFFFTVLSLVPALFILKLVDFPYKGWDEVLWQSSLQNGTFWLMPGHVIFQNSMKIGGEGFGGASFISFVIIAVPTILAAIGLFRLMAWIARALILSGYTISANSKRRTFDGALVHELFPHAKQFLPIASSDALVAISGRSLIIQIESKSQLPILFFDSTSNDIAKREGRRILFSQKDELVFDGTTFEHFRIYAPEEIHLDLTKILTAEALSTIVKELDKAELTTSKHALTMIIDIKAIRIEKDIDMLLSSMQKLRNTLSMSEDNQVSTTKNFMPEFVQDTIQIFGIAVSRFWARVIASLIIAIYVVTLVAAGANAMLGDAVMPTCIAVSFILFGSYRKLVHRHLLVPKSSGEGLL